jgi:hypothetical protein
MPDTRTILPDTEVLDLLHVRTYHSQHYAYRSDDLCRGSLPGMLHVLPQDPLALRKDPSRSALARYPREHSPSRQEVLLRRTLLPEGDIRGTSA